MLLILYVIFTLVMLITTLTLYETLRKGKVTRFIYIIIQKSILLQILFNFGVSSLIMLFTGSSAIAGVSNLTASLLFPIIVYIKEKIIPDSNYDEGTVKDYTVDKSKRAKKITKNTPEIVGEKIGALIKTKYKTLKKYNSKEILKATTSLLKGIKKGIKK